MLTWSDYATAGELDSYSGMNIAHSCQPVHLIDPIYPADPFKPSTPLEYEHNRSIWHGTAGSIDHHQQHMEQNQPQQELLQQQHHHQLQNCLNPFECRQSSPISTISCTLTPPSAFSALSVPSVSSNSQLVDTLISQHTQSDAKVKHEPPTAFPHASSWDYATTWSTPTTLSATDHTLPGSAFIPSCNRSSWVSADGIQSMNQGDESSVCNTQGSTMDHSYRNHQYYYCCPSSVLSSTTIHPSNEQPNGINPPDYCVTSGQESMQYQFHIDCHVSEQTQANNEWGSLATDKIDNDSFTMTSGAIDWPSSHTHTPTDSGIHSTETLISPVQQHKNCTGQFTTFEDAPPNACNTMPSRGDCYYVTQMDQSAFGVQQQPQPQQQSTEKLTTWPASEFNQVKTPSAQATSINNLLTQDCESYSPATNSNKSGPLHTTYNKLYQSFGLLSAFTQLLLPSSFGHSTSTAQSEPSTNTAVNGKTEREESTIREAGLWPNGAHLNSHGQSGLYHSPTDSSIQPPPITLMEETNHLSRAALTSPSINDTPESGCAITTTTTTNDSPDLIELKTFASLFKQRRMKLGITQAEVGRSLGRLKLGGFGCLSQSTICRFESLTLSHNNMLVLKPILQTWLEHVELVRIGAGNCDAGGNGRHRFIEHQSSGNQVFDELDQSNTQFDMAAFEDDGLGALDRRRKRTSITDPEKRLLQAYFHAQPKPSADELSAIANRIKLKKSVVRVWFCNQRQKQKRLHLTRVYGGMSVADYY